MRHIAFYSFKSKVASSLCGWLAICGLLSGCADFLAYNFSNPPKLEVIPFPELHTLADNLSEEERDMCKKEDKSKKEKEKKCKIFNYLNDNHLFYLLGWQNMLSMRLRKFRGWKPDYCELVALMKGDNRFSSLKNIDGRTFYERFWQMNRYVLGIPMDVIDPPIKDIEKNLKECPLGESSTLVAIPGHLLTNDIQTIIERAMLSRIDKDHQSLLIPLDMREKTNWDWLPFWRSSDIPEWRQKREAWENMARIEGRDLSLSKDRPAALSVIARRATKEDEKPPVLSLAAEGQQGFMDLVKSLMVQSKEAGTVRCEDGSSTAKVLQCTEQEAVVKRLLELVKLGDGQNGGFEKFTQKQTVELTISSALNSPDSSNRFDYIATYLYVYPYPYPVHPQVSLAEEFLMRFKARHAQRPVTQRAANLAADLDAAWRDIQVYIDNVETTVITAPIQEIATITRKAESGLELKSLKPSVTLGGTVKGSIEVEGGIRSSIETAVSEKLLKQLDQRSTWLSSERDLLRITQRGNDAVNASGAIREKLTLHIPQSIGDAYLSELTDEGDLKLGDPISYPVYSNVTAFAISLAVVREPSSWKRSSTEKYGLLDSADAYLVVTVSNLDHVPLWPWARIVGALTVDEVDVREHTGAGRKIGGPDNYLMLSSPLLNDSKMLMAKADESAKLLKQLQSALFTVKSDDWPLCDDLRKDDPRLKGRKEKGKLSLCVVNETHGRSGRGYSLKVNPQGDALDSMWLGKMVEGEWRPFDCADLEVLNQYLVNHKVCLSKTIQGS